MGVLSFGIFPIFHVQTYKMAMSIDIFQAQREREREREREIWCYLLHFIIMYIAPSGSKIRGGDELGKGNNDHHITNSLSGHRARIHRDVNTSPGFREGNLWLDVNGYL